MGKPIYVQKLNFLTWVKLFTYKVKFSNMGKPIYVRKLNFLTWVNLFTYKS